MEDFRNDIAKRVAYLTGVVQARRGSKQIRIPIGDTEVYFWLSDDATGTFSVKRPGGVASQKIRMASGMLDEMLQATLLRERTTEHVVFVYLEDHPETADTVSQGANSIAIYALNVGTTHTVYCGGGQKFAFDLSFLTPR